MIFSLEGTEGIIETEQDIKEFVDQEGIRIITFSHLNDDPDLGGAAFLSGSGAFLNLAPWIHQHVLPSGPKCEDTVVNPKGLTDEGKKLARMLVNHKVWIDLTHASDATQRDLIPIMREAGQPLLYTHAVLRKHHGAERGLAQWQIDEIKKNPNSGLIGLLPSEKYLENTKVPKPQCACDDPPGCTGGIHYAVAQYNEMANEIGAKNIMLGSDTNGAVPHLKPTECSSSGTSIDREGFWNIGQTRELWESMKSAGASIPVNTNPGEHFLEKWSLLWKK